MPKKTKIALIVIGVLIVISFIGLTYAFLARQPITGNLDNTIVLSTIDYGKITVTYENGNNQISAAMVNLTQQNAGTNNYYMIKFQINSTANITQDIQIRWKDLVNTFCQYRDNNYECDDPATTGTFVGDDLSYQLYSCTSSQYTNITTPDDTDISTCTKISATTDEAVPKNGVDTLHTSENITLQPKTTTYYVVRVILKNLNSNQNYSMGDTFGGAVTVSFPFTPFGEIITAANPPVSDAIASTYVTSATGVDFSQISSLTNGQGLYINNKVNIANDPTTGLVKYFRGGSFCAYTGYASEVSTGTQCTTAGGTWTNYTCSYDLSKSACEGAGFTWYELKNNVKFADKYWKIIRIAEDGNIRLLYNGNATNATEVDTQYEISRINSLNNDAAYVGYMIPNFTGNTTSVLEARRNDTDSIIKGIVDDFYDEVLDSYTDKIANAGYCGDRSITSGPGFGASTTDWTYYGSFTRLYTNKTPTYSCPSSNDLYTMTTSLVGNKELTKSIGLVTADETAYAGGKYDIANYTYYMQSGSNYWTMSPFAFNPSSGSGVWNVTTIGKNIANSVIHDRGIRPLVSLKPDTTITGGAGTLEDPWIIATN